MTWVEIAKDLQERLKIPNPLDANQQASLALVRAGAELAQRLQGGDPDLVAHRLLHRWLLLVDEGAHKDLARGLPERIRRDHGQPGLALAFAQDDRAAASLPPGLLLLGLLIMIPESLSSDHPGWRYITNAAHHLEQADFLRALHGWLRHDASDGMREQVELLLGTLRAGQSARRSLGARGAAGTRAATH